ncbi:MAG: glutamate--tRNA ligase [Alphaproteobacteria bacterium]|nr:glutamate--tRNA ligase [Alphaproteobacteria bacterium]
MSVVTRFPPSPTGFMHIGNARTALFNWLFARHHGGKFVVRIEDTDRKRHSEEAVEAIIRGLEWLELDWDGEITSQFSRLDRHAEIAQELLKKGEAYYCYCTPEDLEEMREKARAEGQKTFYDRRWRDRDPKDAPAGIRPVIRIKAPLEGTSTIEDHVQGSVSVNNDQLDDFIILRSDGTPTYMLSVVVDDYDMGVTHIIRGDDHLNNAFRQKIIFNAMEWDVPEFAHCPLIHGPDGSKFSKRHGATSVEEYREMGFLPEAMRNYLLRLGWGHGDEEIIPTDKAVEWFDLKGIGKAASRFDFAKLENLNAHYIKIADNERLLKLARPFFEHTPGLTLNEEASRRILEDMNHLKDRSKTILQLVEESAFYARTVPFDYTEKAQKILCDGAKEVLETLCTSLESLESFTAENVERICRETAEELSEGKLGKAVMPLRAAVTGTTVSPPIFNACAVLGREETCTRILAAVKWLEKSEAA